MATSQLDIMNRALSRAKARNELVSVDEDSNEGYHAGVWYDRLRPSLLRAVHWSFARQQAPLALLGTQNEGTGVYPFLYKYAYPADCLAVRYTLPVPPNTTQAWPLAPSRSCRFLIAADTSTPTRTKVILSNVQNALAVYTGDVTETEMFDDLFEVALTTGLASRLAEVVTFDDKLADRLLARAGEALLRAQASDANESIPSTDSIPDWLRARSFGTIYDQGWGQWFAFPTTMNWGA